MPALTSGSSIGSRYTLVRRLGAGGSGAVWLAEDRELEIELALKIVLEPDALQADRLRRDWRVARRLTHPGIARVFDFEHQDAVALLTMEYVEGRDLTHWLGAPATEVIALSIPIADALDYAHRQGVVHRDLKLSHVLVDPEGRPRLLGFADPSLDAATDPPGGGSSAGASPQQLRGEPARPSDDIYGFGTMIYELLSGRPPFWPDLTAERVLSEPPDPVQALHPLPPGLQQLLGEMLAKLPAQRPADMTAVRDRLEVVRSATPRIRPDARRQHEPSDPVAPEVRLTPPPRIQPRPPAPIADSADPPPAAERRDRRLRWVSGVAFAVLAIAAVTVFALLPDWLAARKPAVPQDPATAPQIAVDSERSPSTPPPAPTPEAAVDPRQAAAEARAVADDRIRRLESRAASIWAGGEFAASRAEFRRGDQFLLEGEPEAAAAAFRATVTVLESLEPAATEALEQALERGRQAIVEGGSATAREAFELAAAIDPGNAAAAAGLQRAAALPALLAHLDAAADRERRGELQAALNELRQALKIDGGSTEARSAIARIQRRMEESEFSRIMAAGFVALEAGEYARARDTFGQARTLRPDSAEARDGLERAEGGLRHQAISDHRQRGDAAAAAEDWHTAAESYGQVLELDPTLAFAQQGQERSRQRARLGDDLAAHLHHRQRLATPATLVEARQVLDRAREVADPGPVLTAQIAELEGWVLAYSTPVRVALSSDDHTEVEIYRVGSQGTFERRDLELLPGTYTVVGRRSGFQDVRLKLEVLPNGKPVALTVRCEARI